jgi:methylmalonyl-CoA/ethylmalonyl-CoA epimerase
VIERIDNIGIAVTDFQRSAAWYRKLGFACDEEFGDSGSFTSGAAVLYIFQTDSGDPARARALDLVHNAPGIDHISLRVADVDAAHQALLAHGVEIEDPPANQDWGSRTITLIDPDGNRIYFLGPLTP